MLGPSIDRDVSMRSIVHAAWLAPLAAALLSSCADQIERVSGHTDSGIYYEVEGDGPALVLAHGFSLDSRMWRGNVSRLRSRFRVVRYDLRGHGKSDPWTEPFSPVQDMLDVFGAAGLERAVIVGLSAGAETAIDFALAHPERVQALVLASSGLSGYQPIGSFDWLAPVMSELRQGRPESANRLWVETPIMAIPDAPRADSIMREIVLDNWKVWTYDPALQQRPDRLAIQRLTELRAPTLVLVGENDLIDTKRVSDTLAACIGGAELVEIASAGHLLNLEAPERFGDAVMRFLEHAVSDADAVDAATDC